MSVPPSKPDNIRQVFRNHPNVILSRRQVITEIVGYDYANSHCPEVQYLSMALSRLKDTGKLNVFKLLDCEGYMLKA